jgi:hypothetical protein
VDDQVEGLGDIVPGTTARVHGMGLGEGGMVRSRRERWSLLMHWRVRISALRGTRVAGF